MFICAFIPLVCLKKNSLSRLLAQSIAVFSLSSGSMRPHWYGPEPPIDPLCLVFVLGHYGDEEATFYGGVREERRLFNSSHKNEAMWHQSWLEGVLTAGWPQTRILLNVRGCKSILLSKETCYNIPSHHWMLLHLCVYVVVEQLKEPWCVFNLWH